MTGQPPAAPARRAPARDDLTTRIFRALYQAYDLHWVYGIHIAVPKDSPCFAATSLGEVARQISQYEHPAPPGPGPAT